MGHQGDVLLMSPTYLNGHELASIACVSKTWASITEDAAKQRVLAINPNATLPTGNNWKELYSYYLRWNATFDSIVEHFEKHGSLIGLASDAATWNWLKREYKKTRRDESMSPYFVDRFDEAPIKWESEIASRWNSTLAKLARFGQHQPQLGMRRRQGSCGTVSDSTQLGNLH